MKEIKDIQKIYNIIDEFSNKFSSDSDNEFMIEFAERNLHEFVSDSDEIIRNLNCFTNNKSLKIAVYTYIFGLLFSALNSNNSTVIDRINITLSIIGELLSEGNKNLKAEREISEGYKYALDKLQETKWHKYPEDKPKKDGSYLITTIYSHIPEVITESYENGEFNLDAFVVAWAEKPSPYEEKDNE